MMALYCLTNLNEMTENSQFYLKINQWGKHLSEKFGTCFSFTICQKYVG